MRAIISAIFICFISVLVPAQIPGNMRVNVTVVTDEADAVLNILEKKENARELTETDWQRVFSSEGYLRLKKRELAMGRPFAEQDFRAFVLSEKTAQDRAALAETLAKWKEVDIQKV